MHLDARSQFFLDRQRRLGDVAQDAVDAQADPVELFERLEVQVGCTHVDRVGQDFLQEAHDRRVVDIGIGAVGQSSGIVVDKIDVQIVADQLVQVLLVALIALLDQFQQTGVVDDHRLDRQFGLELDLVQRMDIGRIRQRHDTLLPRLAERNHALALHQLVVDDLFRQQPDIDRPQIQQRIAEFFGAECRQRARVDQGAVQQYVNERDFFLRSLLAELLRLGQRQPAGLLQRARET